MKFPLLIYTLATLSVFYFQILALRARMIAYISSAFQIILLLFLIISSFFSTVFFIINNYLFFI